MRNHLTGLLGLLLGALARAQSIADVPVPLVTPPSDETLRTAAELLGGPEPGRDMGCAGQVIDADGNPLAGADVWLIPDGPTLRALGWTPRWEPAWTGLRAYPPPLLGELPLAACAHTRTGPDGRFVLAQHLEDGERYGLTGLRELPTGPVVAVALEGRAVDVHFVHSRDATDPVVDLGRIDLPLEAVVEGRVVDARGAALAGAVVRVTNQAFDSRSAGPKRFRLAAFLPERHSTRTDADGRFQLGGLWEGHVSLLVDHAAHRPQQVERAALQAGRTTSLPDIRLEDGLLLSGVVVDSRGAPVSDARVAASGWRLRHYGLGCMVGDFREGDDTLPTELLAAYEEGARVVRTDATGAFTIDGLAASDVQLFVEAEGLAPTVLRDLVPPLADVRVVMPELAELLIRVVDQVGGEPLPGARLRAHRCQQIHAPHGSIACESDVLLEPETLEDDPGSFRVRGAGPVRTHIVAAVPGFVPTAVDVLGLEPGAHERVDVVVQPHPGLGGRLVDRDGGPVGGAEVRLFRAGVDVWRDLARVRSDDDGRFAFTSVGGGVFDLAIAAPGYGARVVRGVDTRVEGPALVLALEPAAHLEVSLAAGSGKPLDGNVSLVRQGTDDTEAQRLPGVPMTRTTFDADGTARWKDLPAGRYDIRRRHHPDRSVELKAGETTRVVLDEGTGYRVTGRITRGGRPVSASVGIELPNGDGYRLAGHVSTDEAGVYEAWLPAAGRCRVCVTPDAEVLPEDGLAPQSVRQPASVVDGAPRSSVQLDVALPSGRLTGRLLWADSGEALVGASICLLDGQQSLGWSYTDTEGRFGFADVPDGEYTLECRPARAPVSTASSRVVVRDGQAVDGILVELPPADGDTSR